MKVSIIKEDGVVGVGGVFYSIDLQSLPKTIRAVQYDTVKTVGHIEFNNDKPNQPITSYAGFAPFNPLVTAWEAKDYEVKNPLVVEEPVVIPPVTPRQIRLALSQLGLRSAVEAAVASADQDTKDTWEFATSCDRDNPLLVGMATSLGMTSTDIDNLFLLAGTK